MSRKKLHILPETNLLVVVLLKRKVHQLTLDGGVGLSGGTIFTCFFGGTSSGARPPTVEGGTGLGGSVAATTSFRRESAGLPGTPMFGGF